MPEPLPPVTPAQRQRLQKLWEEARGLVARHSGKQEDAERIHRLLVECAAADPGNTVYIDALLMNLRELSPRNRFGSSTWDFLLPRSGPVARRYLKEFPAGGPVKALALGPAALRDSGRRFLDVLTVLATACGELDLPQAEIRYLQECLHSFPRDPSLTIWLARALIRQGRFDEARSIVEASGLKGEPFERMLSLLNGGERDPASLASLQQVVQEKPTNAEAHLSLANALVDLGQFDAAEAAAAKALSLSGGDLAIREQVEDISLARLKNNVAIARRLVEHEPNEPHQQTLRRWEEELGRLELATLNARSERFPQDAKLKLEVAVRLRRAGNYSGAIQRLDEIAADSSLRPTVLIELGECWQHLRQFEKALGYYFQAVSAADTASQPDPLHLALYRAGTLAAAMQRIPEAQAVLQRLVSLAPDYKDAQQRLRALS